VESVEILNGLYRQAKPHIIRERHGGTTIQDEVYWYLAFYGDNDFVGLYGSGPTDHRRYHSRQFDLKGKITDQSDNTIRISVINPNNKTNLIFEGKTFDENRILKLIAYDENTPDDIWIDDDFAQLQKINT
jgi:hypothetical protein